MHHRGSQRKDRGDRMPGQPRVWMALALALLSPLSSAADNTDNGTVHGTTLENGLEVNVVECRVLLQHLPRRGVHALHGHGGIGSRVLKLCARGRRTYSQKITPNQPESPCCG